MGVELPVHRHDLDKREEEKESSPGPKRRKGCERVDQKSAMNKDGELSGEEDAADHHCYDKNKHCPIQ